MSSLTIVNVSVYFAAAGGEPAVIEVYIQVLRTEMVLIIWHKIFL
jgi:hypothetical protein